MISTVNCFILHRKCGLPPPQKTLLHFVLVLFYAFLFVLLPNLSSIVNCLPISVLNALFLVPSVHVFRSDLSSFVGHPCRILIKKPSQKIPKLQLSYIKHVINRCDVMICVVLWHSGFLIDLCSCVVPQ